MLLVSRPLLEWYVRQRLFQDARIEIREDARSSTWRSLRTTRGSSASSSPTATAASRPGPGQLVVDASGRNSRTIEWIERRGYSAPPEDVRRVDKRYATHRLRPRRRRRRAFGRRRRGPPRRAAQRGPARARGRRVRRLARRPRRSPAPAGLAGVRRLRTLPWPPPRWPTSWPGCTRWTPARRTASRQPAPAVGACRGSPTGSWSPATRSASSTPSTDRG